MDYPLPKRGVLIGVLDMEYIDFVPTEVVYEKKIASAS
jgi:hypothetical protein